VDGLCGDPEPSKVSGFPVQKRILHWCRRLTRQTRIRRRHSPDPPPVPAVMTATNSTRIRSLARVAC
jgi:hypothetical protein